MVVSGIVFKQGVDGIQQFTNKSSLGQLGFKTNTKFKTQLN
jgi:hypothetical protein